MDSSEEDALRDSDGDVSSVNASDLSPSESGSESGTNVSSDSASASDSDSDHSRAGEESDSDSSGSSSTGSDSDSNSESVDRRPATSIPRSELIPLAQESREVLRYLDRQQRYNLALHVYSAFLLHHQFRDSRILFPPTFWANWPAKRIPAPTADDIYTNPDNPASSVLPTLPGPIRREVEAGAENRENLYTASQYLAYESNVYFGRQLVHAANQEPKMPVEAQCEMFGAVNRILDKLIAYKAKDNSTDKRRSYPSDWKAVVSDDLVGDTLGRCKRLFLDVEDPAESDPVVNSMSIPRNTQRSGGTVRDQAFFHAFTNLPPVPSGHDLVSAMVLNGPSAPVEQANVDRIISSTNVLNSRRQELVKEYKSRGLLQVSQMNQIRDPVDSADSSMVLMASGNSSNGSDNSSDDDAGNLVYSWNNNGVSDDSSSRDDSDDNASIVSDANNDGSSNNANAKTLDVNGSADSYDTDDTENNTSTSTSERMSIEPREKSDQEAPPNQAPESDSGEQFSDVEMYEYDDSDETYKGSDDD
uniref:ARAD1D02860p n=1 Tax=Blastobotrys adeninivorans TaxID=409370 RepID=A0A060TDU3_BLAAD